MRTGRHALCASTSGRGPEFDGSTRSRATSTRSWSTAHAGVMVKVVAPTGPAAHGFGPLSVYRPLVPSRSKVYGALAGAASTNTADGGGHHRAVFSSPSCFLHSVLYQKHPVDPARTARTAERLCANASRSLWSQTFADDAAAAVAVVRLSNYGLARTSSGAVAACRRRDGRRGLWIRRVNRHTPKPPTDPQDLHARLPVWVCGEPFGPQAAARQPSHRGARARRCPQLLIIRRRSDRTGARHGETIVSAALVHNGGRDDRLHRGQRRRQGHHRRMVHRNRGDGGSTTVLMA